MALSDFGFLGFFFLTVLTTAILLYSYTLGKKAIFLWIVPLPILAFLLLIYLTPNQQIYFVSIDQVEKAKKVVTAEEFISLFEEFKGSEKFTNDEILVTIKVLNKFNESDNLGSLIQELHSKDLLVELILRTYQDIQSGDLHRECGGELANQMAEKLGREKMRNLLGLEKAQRIGDPYLDIQSGEVFKNPLHYEFDKFIFEQDSSVISLKEAEMLLQGFSKAIGWKTGSGGPSAPSYPKIGYYVTKAYELDYSPGNYQENPRVKWMFEKLTGEEMQPMLKNIGWSNKP